MVWAGNDMSSNCVTGISLRTAISVVYGIGVTALSPHVADLHRLATLAAQPEALHDVLAGALAALQELVPHDLAVIYELRDGELRVRAAEGPLADARVRAHRLRLDAFPTIRRALRLRRPIALGLHHHDSNEGDPYDGLLDLPPGHSCMVVPLHAGPRDLGVITFDRSECGAYSRETVELAGVYGQVVAVAMLLADEAAHLAEARHRLAEHNRLLHAELGTPRGARDILRASRAPAMRELVKVAERVAETEVPVLIQGETGVGKEVVAQALHCWSARAEGPFVKLNCAAIPEALVESELFGHVKGAFSGAVADRPGRFQTAHGGTLLLDEIGDLPPATQGKLLRVLQEGAFEPVGSDKTVEVDVRVLAATHVDLQAAVAAGTFREDLYYRLAVFPITVPPLRERSEDVVGIARQTLERVHERSGRGPWTLSPGASEALEGAPWPGNVRQLVNAMERATILQPEGAIRAEHLALVAGQGSSWAPASQGVSAGSFPTFADNERAHLRAALGRTNGRIYGPDGAAALLGLKPTTLQSKLKKHSVQRSG